jgi:hypothetical protein
VEHVEGGHSHAPRLAHVGHRPQPGAGGEDRMFGIPDRSPAAQQP